MNHATLCQGNKGTYALYTQDERYVPVPSISFPDLFATMMNRKIDTMWVHPETDLSKSVDHAMIDAIPRQFDTYHLKREKQPSFIRMRQGGYHGDTKFIAFPAHGRWKDAKNDDKGIWYLPSAHALNTTVDYIEREIGIPLAWSPGHAGIELLRNEHLAAREHIEPLSLTLRPEWDQLAHQMMIPVSWRKLQRSGLPGLSEENRCKKYVIGVDKNAQYLGIASSATLGNGNYTHVDASHYDEKSIGFWKYRITDVSKTPFNGYDLPCFLDVKYSWASTELIRAARYVGIELDILEGIVWTQGKPYLKRWAKDMFARRINLRDAEKYESEIARENAEATMKLIANSLMGRLENAKANREYAMYHHPDWNRLIVHGAIASQAFTLNALARSGVRPVLVCKDAFYILSDTDNPAMAVPTLAGKLNPDMQGGFKVKGVCRLTNEIIDAFANRKLHNHTKLYNHSIETLIVRAMRDEE